jgi:hypothetical protein
MKPLLLFLAISSPLCVLSQNDPTQTPTPNSPQPSAPPAPNGNVAGRFLVQTLNTPGEDSKALRIDTLTGRAWTLERALSSARTADGGIRAVHHDYWKLCLEADAMEWIEQRDAAPSPAPK